jgi:hypothetical protein
VEGAGRESGELIRFALSRALHSRFWPPRPPDLSLRCVRPASPLPSALSLLERLAPNAPYAAARRAASACAPRCSGEKTRLERGLFPPCSSPRATLWWPAQRRAPRPWRLLPCGASVLLERRRLHLSSVVAGRGPALHPQGATVSASLPRATRRPVHAAPCRPCTPGRGTQDVLPLCRPVRRPRRPPGHARGAFSYSLRFVPRSRLPLGLLTTLPRRPRPPPSRPIAASVGGRTQPANM